MKVPFQYATRDYLDNPEPPQIYIVSSLTKDQQTDRNENCRNFTEGYVSESTVAYIEDTTDDQTKYYVHPIYEDDNFITIDDIDYGNLLWVNLGIYEEWFNTCKYEFVAIQWENGNDDIPLVWCNLSSGSCEEKQDLRVRDGK